MQDDSWKKESERFGVISVERLTYTRKYSGIYYSKCSRADTETINGYKCSDSSVVNFCDLSQWLCVE